MNESSPRLSIITPSYNQGEFIADNIKSVIDQEFNDVEHIVIDNESQDNTVKILKNYQSEYDLRWVSEPDQGQSDAINKGIKMARGEFIGWINADDYYCPGAFSVFQQVINRCPRVDVIYGDLIHANDEGKQIRRRYHTYPSKYIHKHWRNFTANHCTFIRKSVFDSVGYIREDLEYVMDRELFFRLLNQNLVYKHQSEFIAVHRLHANAKTTGELNKRHKKERKYLDKEYTVSSIEKLCPDFILRYSAVALTILFFIYENRWSGIKNLIIQLGKALSAVSQS